MQENRRVRLISKRDRTAEQSPSKPVTAESKERQIKAVVSGWVSEHRLRTEEFRRTFTTLLGVAAN